jgi:FixJ family two-component response regulator
MHQDSYYRTLLNRDRLIQIVDADPLTCESLSVLFRLEGFQTGFSMDAAHFLALLERRQPDAVLLNLRLGNDSGLNLLRRVVTQETAIPVIMLADTAQVEAAVTAMKLGAVDVLSKPLDSEQVLALVQDAVRRLRPSPGPGEGLPLSAARGFDQLTPRERDVLRLISNGQSNKEAGRELGISPRTIEVHRARVMEKLGAKNTADLMRKVLTAG